MHSLPLYAPYLSPYALMTHLCSLYTIGPPSPCVTVMSPWDLVYRSKVDSLYSLVLISQDFLFSCLPLCDTFSWTSFNLPPLSPLRSSLYLSLSGPSHRT